MTREEIEQQIHEFAEKMYQAGYAYGSNPDLMVKAYQEGLNDAWGCVKKIVYPTEDGGLSTHDLKEIFGDAVRGRSSYIVRNFSPSEAIRKIEDYEERQKQKADEIRVGDEVYVISENNKSVVTHIFNNSHGPVAMLLSGDAKWIDVELQYLNKTGKHYDAIDDVLNELRGDEE